MDIAYISQSLAPLGTAENTVLTAPANIQDGDGLIILHYVEDVATPPDGFVPFTNLNPLTFPVNTIGRMYAWGKIAAGESGDYTIIHASAFRTAIMLVYRNVDATLEDVPPSTNSGNNDPNIVANSITPVTNRALILYAAVGWNGFPAPHPPPSGATPVFTERVDGFESITGTMCASDGILAVAGATGNKTVTGGPVADDWVATLIALRANQSQSQTRKRRRMLLDAKPVKGLSDVAADETTSQPFGLTDDIVITVDFKTGVTAGVVTFESAPGADYTGTWKEEATITFAGTAPLTLSDRIAPENAVGRLRISTAIADGVIDAYIQRSLSR